MDAVDVFIDFAWLSAKTATQSVSYGFGTSKWNRPRNLTMWIRQSQTTESLSQKSDGGKEKQICLLETKKMY